MGIREKDRRENVGMDHIVSSPEFEGVLLAIRIGAYPFVEDVLEVALGVGLVQH
jgi:hypothetical protein